MARRTFTDARRDLLEYLRAEGWDVKTWGPQGALKVPHATNRSGDVRLWFKPQAVYVSYGRGHELGHSRSLWVDIRTTSPEDVVRQAEHGSSRDPGRKRAMAGRPRRRRLLARLRRDMDAMDPSPRRRRRRDEPGSEAASDPGRRRRKRRDAADPSPRRRKRRRDWKGFPKEHATAARKGWKRVAKPGWKPKKRSAKKRAVKKRRRDWEGHPKEHAAASRKGWRRVARTGPKWRPKKRSAKKRSTKRAKR